MVAGTYGELSCPTDGSGSASTQHPTLSEQPSGSARLLQGKKQAFLYQAVQDLLLKEAIYPVLPSTPEYYSHLFLVQKPDGHWRPILDLSQLNRYLRTEKFQQETFHGQHLSI